MCMIGTLWSESLRSAYFVVRRISRSIRGVFYLLCLMYGLNNVTSFVWCGLNKSVFLPNLKLLCACGVVINLRSADFIY